MPSRAITTEKEAAGWCKAIMAQPLPLTVSFLRGVKRTNPQNATIHMWYKEAAIHLGDTTDLEVRAECKLIFGVPILRRDSATFRHIYDDTFRPLEYSRKLALFKILDPAITSTMNTKQLSEYMDAMVMHFAQSGIRLTDPSLRKYEGTQ